MVAILFISIILIAIGFFLLFLRTDTQSELKKVQNNLNEIIWAEFSSDIFEKDILYPSYLYTITKKDNFLVGASFTERKTDELPTYFTNQNHISFYPEGIDNQFFYGKTKESQYTSATGQEYSRIEYLTNNDQVWAILLAPKDTPKGWQSKGFIWIQSFVKNKEQLCISQNGILISNIECDPYSGEQPIYKGEISQKFIDLGYEVINKNKI